MNTNVITADMVLRALPIELAACIWAAAAGAAGAYAPEHIAAHLLASPEDGLAAALEHGLSSAYEQAYAEADGLDFVTPRGATLRYASERGGMRAYELVWETSVETALCAPVRGLGDDWYATVRLPEHVTRVAAARAACEVWCAEHDVEPDLARELATLRMGDETTDTTAAHGAAES